MAKKNPQVVRKSKLIRKFHYNGDAIIYHNPSLHTHRYIIKNYGL